MELAILSIQILVLRSRSAQINRSSAGGPVDLRPETRSGINRSFTSTSVPGTQYQYKIPFASPYWEKLYVPL